MGRKNSAFTLVELIIVILIIAILAVIALAYYRTQIFKANDARRKADLERIRVAVEEYEKDHNCYPALDLMYCNVPPLNGTGLRPYLDQIPCDPVTHSSYYYEVPDNVCAPWYWLYTNVQNTDQNAMALCGPSGSFDYYAGSPNAPGCNPQSSSGPSASSTPTGGASGNYGCKNQVCVSISWDPARPGPECDPHYSNDTCNDQCSAPSNACVPWTK